VTVIEAIQKSADFLAKKGVGSPRLQTELLLARLLKLPRMSLYLNFERELSPSETDALREFVKRRGLREPLQHIVGSTSFCGIEIVVNRHALVPRPETELLAEAGWQFLQGRAGLPVGQDAQQRVPTSALDFGTGTGCIAIALATKCPNAKIVATDVSAEALALAKENATANKLAERIEFLEGGGFAALSGAEERGRPARELDNTNTRASRMRSFDLIISNAPYSPSAEIATLQPEVRDFDPRAALDGGLDGLDFYRQLGAEAKPFLKPDGKIMMEFGDGQAEAVKTIFETAKWIVEAVNEDYSQRARIMIAKSSSSSPSSS
jgi:release factor glutamine methyltransferase